MKIALLNGSPKAKDSGSGVILKGLADCLGGGHEIRHFQLRAPRADERSLEEIVECDALVVASPLYVDGLPSHLLSWMAALEKAFHSAPPRGRMAYGIVNCGFYEGCQNATAIKMMENWCARAGLQWGQGLGVGGGGMLTGLEGVPMGRGPRKSLGAALEALAQRVLSHAQADTVFITANFPRFAYKAAAEFGWRKMVKANGLAVKELGRRL